VRREDLRADFPRHVLTRIVKHMPTLGQHFQKDSMSPSSFRIAAFVNKSFGLTLCALACLAVGSNASAQPTTYEYRVLATSKTSTLEKELNEAADAGFRFSFVMGGETAIGGSEGVAVLTKTGSGGKFAYKLLATSKTSTMQKELQEASDAGFEYRGQTVFKSTFGGDEVVCILERDKAATPHKFDYKLVATTKTSTLEKELREAGAAGYEVMGMTVSKTVIGGKELVAITRRAR
jgi:hypothetical protein